MIPSEKGSVFGDFWYVTSKKIPQKSPFFLLAPAIVFRCFQASELPGRGGARINRKFATVQGIGLMVVEYLREY
jgi:hypothetical protein